MQILAVVAKILRTILMLIETLLMVRRAARV